MSENVEKGAEMLEFELLIPEDVGRGHFANHFSVTYSPEDFRLDFGYLVGKQAVLNARIIVTPSHLKRIQNAIGENLKRYEARFGLVPEKVIEKHSAE